MDFYCVGMMGPHPHFVLYNDMDMVKGAQNQCRLRMRMRMDWNEITFSIHTYLETRLLGDCMQGHMNLEWRLEILMACSWFWSCLERRGREGEMRWDGLGGYE